MKFFIFTIFSSTIAMQRQLSPVERLSSVIAGLNEWKDLHLTGYKRYDSLTSKIIKTEGRLLERLQEPCAQPTPETDMEEIDDDLDAVRTEDAPIDQMKKYIRIVKRVNRIYVGQCGKNLKIKTISEKLQNGLEKAFIRMNNF